MMSRLTTEVHPLLTQNIVEALHSKQINTVCDFLEADTHRLMKITLFNFKELLALKTFLLKTYSAAPRNGLDYHNEALVNSAIVPPGVKNLDKLLNGGFFTGNIYEICGLPNSGKTHLSLTIVKNVVTNSRHHVYYLDSKFDFRASKLSAMLDNNTDKMKMEECLSRILIKRLDSASHLINSFFEIKKDLEKGLKLRLIVIDSLPVLSCNVTDSRERNSMLNHLANVMRFISTQHHVVIVIVNAITSWHEGIDLSKAAHAPAPAETIACGKYWQSVANTRLKIEREEDQAKCTISVIRSDILYSNEVKTEIELTSLGFV